MKEIKNLSDIKLYQYLELMDYLDTNPAPEDITIQTISILCEVGTLEIRKMPYDAIEQVALQLNKVLGVNPKFQPRIKFQGMDYGFVPNLDKLSTGEFVDLDTLQSDRKNLWKIMSILYRPIKDTAPYDHYTIQPYKAEFNENFKQLPVDVALSSHVFFCDIGIDLLTFIQKSLADQKTEKTKRTQKNSELIQALSALIKNGDGLDSFTDYVTMTLQKLKEFRNCLFIKPLDLQVIELTKGNYKKN